MDVKILVGDCRHTLKKLPDSSVNCVVTSPPYFGLRDYGNGLQIGLEATPEEYVAEMVSAFREVRRVLREDGTLWLNLGDSYAGGGHGSRDEARWPKQASNDHAPSRPNRTGLQAKQLIGIPWRVAFALQSDGWCLRQDIIWHKPNPMPESVKDRCTKAHEYVFMFSKSSKYFYDVDAIREPHKYAHDKRNDGRRHTYAADAKHNQVDGSRQRTKTDCVSFHPLGRNKRTVWAISTKPYKGAHFATFPPDLVRPCILAGCPAGGTVLDPFGGSGTTGLVALENQRNAILCELNPEYAEMARGRCEGSLLDKVEVST